MNARADSPAERRVTLTWQALLPPLVAASIALVPAGVTALVAFGVLQNRIEQVEFRTARMERFQEEGQRADMLVLQRLATVEAKIDSLRELVTRRQGLLP